MPSVGINKYVLRIITYHVLPRSVKGRKWLKGSSKVGCFGWKWVWRGGERKREDGREKEQQEAETFHAGNTGEAAREP